MLQINQSPNICERDDWDTTNEDHVNRKPPILSRVRRKWTKQRTVWLVSPCPFNEENEEEHEERDATVERSRAVSRPAAVAAAAAAAAAEQAVSIFVSFAISSAASSAKFHWRPLVKIALSNSRADNETTRWRWAREERKRCVAKVR